MPTDKPRVTITLAPEQLQRIDDFRFENKMKNQTQAILFLIEAGLAELDEEIKKSPDTAETASGEMYGLSPRMSALYAAMGQLNDEGQEKVVDYADDLVSSGKYIKSSTTGLGKRA